MAIMAGIVAGAESARRRQQQQQRRQQLRQAESAADSAAVGSRRPSSSSSSSSSSLFYHATKGNETQLNRQIVRGNNNNNNNNYYYYMNKEFHDWNLGSGAREAKERLDEKLRNQRASSSSVIKSMVSIVGALQKEIFSYRKSGTRRRFNWSRLAWNKNVEAKPDHAATECAVCLEEFRAGDELTHLPCAHRFHRSCAVPWLEISPHCPFCRTCIFSSSR